VKSVEDPTEIIAALLWDVPRLRAGSPPARDFAAALPGELERWWEPREYEDDVLGRAAQAIARERANELREAANLYDSLVAEKDVWSRLLGLMLRAWSQSEEGTGAITEARTLLEEISPPPELTARLLAKLVTYAFDEGAFDMGRKFLGEAIELAPERTRLWRVLAVEGLNVGLPYKWSENEAPTLPDPLVDYPWIYRDSLSAAQDTLAAAVEMRSRRLWTFQWRVGRTPLDEAIGAEVQATWAGALWMRRSIRKQLGAQLLTGAARTPAQWGYGVVMWALGAGGQPERAYALAEPRLDQRSTDFILQTLGHSEISPGSSDRFLSVAAEAWDALSDDVFRWMIEMVEPTEEDHPVFRKARIIWASYAARLPEEWFPRFKQLSDPVRISLLETLGIDIIKGVSHAARQAIFETARTALLERSDVDTHLLLLLAETAPLKLEQEIHDAVAEKASASAIARLAYEGYRRLLSKDVIQRAEKMLMDALRAQSEKARSGTVSFGPEDVRVSLGRLVAGRSSKDPEAIRLLMETAVDRALPSEHLLHARNGLTLIRRAGKLGPSDLRTLHDADDPGGTFPQHGDISPELLQVARLQILALDLTPDEVATVVGACRVQDAKVRQIALATCAEAAQAPGDSCDRDALAWALIGGLFDPNDEVVVSAMSGVNLELIDRYPAVGRVAIERFSRLFEEGSMPVRATVSALARKWAGESTLSEDPSLRGILIRAQNDRSWIVRDSVLS
jgi:hypothetical protein